MVSGAGGMAILSHETGETVVYFPITLPDYNKFPENPKNEDGEKRDKADDESKDSDDDTSSDEESHADSAAACPQEEKKAL